MPKLELKDKLCDQTEGIKLKWVQRLFKELSKNQAICSAEFFTKFLSMVDRNAFEKEKKAVAKLPQPKSFADIQNLNGKAKVKLDHKNIELMKHIDKFIGQSYELHRRLMETTDDISALLRKLSYCLKEQTNIYKELASLSVSVKVI